MEATGKNEGKTEVVRNPKNEGLAKLAFPKLQCSQSKFRVEVNFGHEVSFYTCFQGGDPVEFRLVNDAYNRLICHIDTLEIIEAEAELSNTSVVIEVSKHSLPKWWDKLKTTYGKPRTANVANTIFQVLPITTDSLDYLQTLLKNIFKTEVIF